MINRNYCGNISSSDSFCSITGPVSGQECSLPFNRNCGGPEPSFGISIGPSYERTKLFDNLFDGAGMKIYNCNQKQEDNQKMSFVGLQLRPGERKVVAFADSKTSRIDEHGNLFQDFERGNINKIFQAEEYIAVTFGGNELHGDYGHSIPIEYVFEQYSKDGIGNILERIQELFGDDDSFAHIFVLFTRKGSIYYEIAEISAKNITTEKRRVYGNIACIGGDSFYHNVFQRHLDINNCSPGEIKEKIEMVIDFRDKMDTYNPVGKPIQIVEWDWG